LEVSSPSRQIVGRRKTSFGPHRQPSLVNLLSFFNVFQFSAQVAVEISLALCELLLAVDEHFEV
jgi:hypothetical protein